MQRDEEVVYLYLDDIIPNRFQPREIFDERPLKELAVSIKEHGVIQPIIVRKVNDKYEIIAGERRYKASALAGLTKIPAIIRDLDDKESSKVALLENLQRRDLNPIEEAKTYQKILELDEMTQEDLAKTMGKSQSSVANKLRLLSLPEEIQKALMDEKISERHARALLNIKDSNQQQQLLQEIIDQKMTVRQLEDKIKEGQQPQMNSISDASPMQPSLEKENNGSMIVPGQENYISNQPLMPSFLNNQEETKSEPILITPSGEDLIKKKEEETPPEPALEDNSDNNQKFINFGEINDDDDDDEGEEPLLSNNISFGNAPETTSSNPSPNPISLEAMKENTSSVLPPPESNSNANLDSLLQINNPIIQNNNNSDGNDFKFFSSAQEAINESEKEDTKTTEDYFKAPDLINVDIPGEVVTPPNNVSLSQANYDLMNQGAPMQTIQFGDNGDNNKVQNSIDSLKDMIKQIEGNGVKIEYDEMNLEKSYQMIIKIEK